MCINKLYILFESKKSLKQFTGKNIKNDLPSHYCGDQFSIKQILENWQQTILQNENTMRKFITNLNCEWIDSGELFRIESLYNERLCSDLLAVKIQWPLWGCLESPFL
jgi:hypothetical protein